MDQQIADDVAEQYEQWTVTGDRSGLTLFSDDLFDHVSGRQGLTIFDVVAAWLEESFADRRVERHATMFDSDRVMVWNTVHGRHVGNGLPRMSGLPVTGADIAWSQMHVFRLHGELVVEHWAVRDDFGMIETITNNAR